MFKAKLKAVYQDLTQSEKLVADYILEHIDEIRTITSHQLAVNTHIGQSTIIRFSQKLGYNSFRELLADLSAIPRQDLVREEIQVNESMTDTNRKIIAQYHDIVEVSFENNKEETIQQACEMLTSAKKIILFGIGSSNLFCEYLANQLVKMGLLCVTSQTPHTIYSLIDQSKKDTVLFLISESGETREVIKAASIAKEHDMPIIAMTRMAKNTLHSYADLILKTVSFETETRLNVTTMRCSQLYLIDALYLNIMKSNFNKFSKMIERAELLSDRKL